MRRVILESPYAGNVERNTKYLRACIKDCLMRNEAPFASHAIYTQPGTLDDGNLIDRAMGIVAGFSWREQADMTVVYEDFGITSGMALGIADAIGKGQRVEYRRLRGEWTDE